MSGDGLIIADSRFYNLNGFRVRAVTKRTTFFVKRLIHNSSLEVKLRFKFFLWSLNDTNVINAVWSNNWSFFKTAIGKYSYTQMVFSGFNLFRYCIGKLELKIMNL